MAAESFEAYRKKKAEEPQTDTSPVDTDIGYTLDAKPADPDPAESLTSLPSNVERMQVDRARFILSRQSKGRYKIASIYPPLDAVSDEDVSRYL